MTLGPIEEELAAARAAYRNWGRWGEDDVLGTLNFIDDARRAHAAGLVRRGRAISLALEFNEDGPQRGFRGRINPVHYMRDTGNDAAASPAIIRHHQRPRTTASHPSLVILALVARLSG